jgi:diamine N-acetyltransferase
MLIRTLNENDLPALCRFAESTFRAAWENSNDPADFEEYCRTHFAHDVLRAEMRVPDTFFYFAQKNETDRDEILGYLKLNFFAAPPNGTMPAEECLQLERIYIDPALTGQGIGRELLDLVQFKARQFGVGYIWLTVWQEAPRTIAFYEKNGFEIFGTNDFWLGEDKQTDWLMRAPVA